VTSMLKRPHRYRTSTEPPTTDGAEALARGKPKKVPPLAATSSNVVAQSVYGRVLPRRYVIPALALGLCILVLIATQHLSKTLDYHGIIRTLRQLPPGLLIRSLAATTLSYLALIGRDAVALRYIGAKVPRLLLWIGTVAGSALGNAVGFGALTGGAVRYRVYGPAGISATQVARLSVLTGATFAFSLVVLSGLGFAYAAPAISSALGMSAVVVRGCGLIVLAGTAMLIGWCRPEREPLRLGRICIESPARSSYACS
jgi:phosphatidylglycerol lysyltransferase